MIPRFGQQPHRATGSFAADLDTNTLFGAHIVLGHPDKRRTRRGSIKVAQRLRAELQNLPHHARWRTSLAS